MLLTVEERLRFIEYLQNDVESSELLLVQMQKISIPAILIEKTKKEVEAYRIVIEKLSSIQEG